ncbi:MAG: hypothetical protein AAFQ91_30710, partial [Cyanobacteria bacterium J06621_15]
ILMLAGTASQSLAAKGFESLPQTASNQGLLAQNSYSSQTFTRTHTRTVNGRTEGYECQYKEVNGVVYRNGCRRIY